MTKPAKLETGERSKLNVLLGGYHNGVLGLTLRYESLNEANRDGRALEQLGFQVMIRCGVSKLPEHYPFAE